MSEAKIGVNHPMFGIKGEDHPLFGKTHSALSKAKMSTSKGTAIYVYNINGTLVNSFSSARKAAEHFNCNHKIILKHAKKGLLFKDQWVLSSAKNF